MFAIRCPRCNGLIKTRRSALNVKVRCPGCGSVFTGSSEILPDESSAPAPGGSGRQMPWGAGPAMGPSPWGPRLKKRNPILWQLPVVAVGMLAIAIVLTCIWYYAKHPVAVIDGQSRRLEVEEIARRKQQAAEASARGLPSREEEVPLSMREPSQAAEKSTPPPARQERPQPAVSRPPEKKETGVTVEQIDLVPGPTPDRGYIVGAVRNGRGEAISSVQAGFAILNESGQWLLLPPVECRYIPVNGSVRYSVEYAGLDRRDIRQTDWTITDVRCDEKLVCWEIEDRSVRRSLDGGTIALEGETRNGTGKAAWNVKIYCDFYTADGARLCAVEGSLQEKTFLREGESGKFRISLDLSGQGLSPQVVTSYSLRAVGSR